MTEFLAGLVVGAALGGWLALAWRDRVPAGQAQLIRHLYVHVDDLLGATKTENIRRANRRFKVERWLGRGTRNGRKKLGTAIADFFWFVPQYGGVTTLPSAKRMAYYVHLDLGHGPARPWYRRLAQPKAHLWQVQSVTLRPTSEANALVDAYPITVGRKVAQALRLSGVDQLDITPLPDQGLIRYARAEKAPKVPDQISAAEELGV